MILFISSWHLVSVLGVFGGILGLLAFVFALSAAMKMYEITRGLSEGEWMAFVPKGEVDQQQRARRSAAAKRGHETRRAKAGWKADVGVDVLNTPWNRIQQRLDAMKRDEITPDDALVGEDQ